MGLCGSDSPKPPDYSQLAKASKYAADLAFDAFGQQMDWAREQDQKNRATLDRVLNTVLPIQEQTARQAREDRQYLIDTFRPLELQQVEEAKNYDTQARRDFEAGAAISDVTQQFDLARKASEDRLKSYGIDPSQGAFAALESGSAIEQAKAAAGAGYKARKRVEDVGRALRTDAINLGRGLPSSIAGSYGTAINAGNSAVNNSATTMNASTNAFNSARGFLNTGINAVGQGADILNKSFQNALSADALKQQGQSELFGGVGSLAGMAMGAGFKDGGVVNGMITGPGDGSGIDDAISARAKVGTVIIPKDVVDRVGKKNLKRAIGEVPKVGSVSSTVPVRVSSGEMAIPPEKAAPIGYDKLQALIDAYHVPAAVQRRMR